jgi:hypothetical protein
MNSSSVCISTTQKPTSVSATEITASDSAAVAAHDNDTKKKKR